MLYGATIAEIGAYIGSIGAFFRIKKYGSFKHHSFLPRPGQIENPTLENKLALVFDGHKPDGAVIEHSDIMGVVNGQHLMRSVAMKHGYHTKKVTLLNHVFEREIEKAARKSTEDSQTLIYFDTHGNVPTDGRKGLLGYDGRGVWEPAEILGPISEIKGKKAVIIDACFSGRFYDYQESHQTLDDYVLISSAKTDEVGSNYSYFESGFFSDFMFGFYRALLDNEGDFDISSIKIVPGSPIIRLSRRFSRDNDKIGIEIQKSSDTSFIL